MEKALGTSVKVNPVLSMYQEVCRGLNPFIVKGLIAEPYETPWVLIALGKSAGEAYSWARSRCRYLKRAWVGSHQPKPFSLSLGDTWCQGDHPVPEGKSLAAGHSLVQFVSCLEPDIPVLVAVSGGGSSLVLSPKGDPAEACCRYKELLFKGLDIVHMNGLRGALCRLKHGGLRQLLGNRPVYTWVQSDVVDAPAWVVASGPTITQRSLPEEYEVLSDAKAHLRWWEFLAKARGFQVSSRLFSLGGHPRELIHWYKSEKIDRGQPLIQVAVGELLEPVPDGALGGRGLNCGLYVAQAFARECDGIFLGAGSDGRDGPTQAAGCLVPLGLSYAGIDTALATGQSYSFWKKHSALIPAFYSGVNANDCYVLFRGWS